MNGKKMLFIGSLLTVMFGGLFLMGMQSTGSLQSVWNDPAVNMNAFEIWISSQAPTLLRVAGYNNYKTIRIQNPSLSHTIFVGNSDVVTSTATTASDMAKVGYPIGKSTSTYNSFMLNTSLPLYAICSADDVSTTTIHVMLTSW